MINNSSYIHDLALLRTIGMKLFSSKQDTNNVTVLLSCNGTRHYPHYSSIHCHSSKLSSGLHRTVSCTTSKVFYVYPRNTFRRTADNGTRTSATYSLFIEKTNFLALVNALRGHHLLSLTFSSQRKINKQILPWSALLTDVRLSVTRM